MTPDSLSGRARAFCDRFDALHGIWAGLIIGPYVQSMQGQSGMDSGTPCPQSWKNKAISAHDHIAMARITAQLQAAAGPVQEALDALVAATQSSLAPLMPGLSLSASWWMHCTLFPRLSLNVSLHNHAFPASRHTYERADTLVRFGAIEDLARQAISTPLPNWTIFTQDSGDRYTASRHSYPGATPQHALRLYCALHDPDALMPDLKDLAPVRFAGQRDA